jgi:hypothetical protein
VNLASEAIAHIEQPTGAGVLALAVTHADLRSMAKNQFVRASAHTGVGDATGFTEQELKAVCTLLSYADGANWSLVSAAVRVLACTSYGPAAIELNAFVRAYRHVAPHEMIAAAEAAIENIVARQQVAQENRQLLRSADATDTDTTTLLRRAAGDAEPPEQLLRPADD